MWYEGFVKAWKVWHGMQGLSKYTGFVKICMFKRHENSNKTPFADFQILCSSLLTRSMRTYILTVSVEVLTTCTQSHLMYLYALRSNVIQQAMLFCRTDYFSWSWTFQIQGFHKLEAMMRCRHAFNIFRTRTTL